MNDCLPACLPDWNENDSKEQNKNEKLMNEKFIIININLLIKRRANSFALGLVSCHMNERMYV